MDYAAVKVYINFNFFDVVKLIPGYLYIYIMLSTTTTTKATKTLSEEQPAGNNI